MDQKVTFHQDQAIEHYDVNKMQENVERAMDLLVAEAVGPGLFFARLPVVWDSAWKVTVGEGTIFVDGVSYRHRASEVIDLFNSRPTELKRKVSVVANGLIDNEAPENRQFATDAEGTKWESRPVSTARVRNARIELIAGIEAANPQALQTPAGSVLLAVIELSSSGITDQLSIVRNDIAELPQTLRLQLEMAEVQAWRSSLGATLDSIRTDLAGLAEKQSDYVTRIAFDQLRSLIARIGEDATRALDLATELDSASPSFLFSDQDNFANDGLSNDAFTGYSARVDRGLRFPFEASDDTQTLDLVNPFDSRLKVLNDFALPAFEEVTRLSTWQENLSEAASLNAYTTVTIETVSGTRPIYSSRAGEQFVTTYDSRSQTPSEFPPRVDRNGVSYFLKDHTFIGIVGGTPHPNGGHPVGAYYRSQLTYESQSWHGVSGEVAYSYDVSDAVNYTGQGRAQTWLQPQDGWCTSINLFFKDIGAANDVRVMVMEAPGDDPDVRRILAETTVDFADLVVAGASPADGLRVPLPWHLHEAGKRYAVGVLSQGNHLIFLSPGRGAGLGGAFYHLSANGRWEKATDDKAMALRINYARFHSPRVSVDMQPLQLTDGFNGAEIWAETVLPKATRLDYEVQIAGQWYVLGPDIGARLAADLTTGGSLLPLRAVFVGTTDLMPGVGLKASLSGMTTSRAATVLKHASSVRTFGGAANKVDIKFRVANWDAAKHALDIDLDNAGTIIEADVIAETDLGGDVREFLASFDLSGAPLTAASVVIDATTTDANDQFYGVERRLNAYA